MAVIHHLLQRLGFVKLGGYGLVLTPDGRILSTRPAVLDDGAGGAIVGWREDDLAMAELQPWEPARPAARRARRTTTAQIAESAARSARAVPVSAQVAAPAPPQVAAPAPPQAPAPAFPPPTYPAVISEASVLALRPPGAHEAELARTVAPEPTLDEDDWEWTIALARARAAEPAEIPAPPTPGRVAGPALTLPMPVVAPQAPGASGEWFDTRAPTPRAMPIPQVARAASPPVVPPGAAPTTVIPVPTLPTMHGTAHAGRLAPVVRTSAARAAASPRRFAKGTGPVSPRTTSRMAAAMSDDTELHFKVGDRTTPGIAMPPAARAVELPSIKRRTVTR
jgi:hypothetical protein